MVEHSGGFIDGFRDENVFVTFNYYVPVRDASHMYLDIGKRLNNAR